MTPELASPAPFPALPVRRREILEILDTALKLYRRYFWVLIGWSALVSSLALIPFLQWFALFASPLLYGAVACCVAAAVRGQSVKFSQCWAFTKPRYGPLLGTFLLSYLVLFGLFIGIYIAGALIGVLGAWALSNAPQPLQIVGAIVGVVLVVVGLSVLGVGAFGWMSMVPIVVCLEDDKRSTAAMGRAFDLLKGNWRRVFGLSLILGLAVLAVFVLIGAVYLLVGVGSAGDLFGSNPSQSAILGAFASIAGFMGVFFMIWNPVQSLVIAVLYLDLRVRREALDLEWTAYASAPPPLPNRDFAPLEGGGSGSALRVGSPFGEGASTLETPASFGAGRAEIPNPYLAPTEFAPQESASLQTQVPFTENFSPVADPSPPVENNQLINVTTAREENSLTEVIHVPEESLSTTENVLSVDNIASKKLETNNDFNAPDTFPLTSSFSPPSPADLNNAPSSPLEVAPLQNEMLPGVGGPETEARRD